MYTQMNFKSWFLTASRTVEFKPVSIAQLIQVELLRRRQGLAQIQAPFVVKFPGTFEFICVYSTEADNGNNDTRQKTAQ